MPNLNDRLDLAIQEECEEIKQHPTNPNWQLCRRNQSWIVADLLIQSGDHAAAARAAADMASGCSDRWQDCYDAACLMARCVALAMEDETRSSKERSALARSYARQAVGFLSSAIERGFLEFSRLTKDPDLRPLRNHRSFKNLSSISTSKVGARGAE